MRGILVLDLGTSSTKAIVYGEEGKVLSESTAPTPVVYAGSSMEIDPLKLWEVSNSVCRSALSGLSCGITVEALIISSMAATLLPVDEKGRPLYHAIGWADGRPLQRMEAFLKDFHGGYRIKDCGQYPLPMYAAFKIPWFTQEFQHLKDRICKWLNVSDYIYSRFLGEGCLLYTDYSIASRTMLFDDVHKRWNDEALKRFSIDAALFPTALPSGTIIGEIGAEGRAMGFKNKTLVILGGHDHMCASLGAAITKPGTILNSTGTSEAVIAMLAEPYNIQELPGIWVNSESSVMGNKVMAVAYTTASGQIFQSVKNTFSGADSIFSVDEGQGFPPPLNEPVFIPPQRAMLPSVPGMFMHIAPNFGGAVMVQASLEGMYYECRRVCERMAYLQKVSNVTVRCVGGQTKDHEMLQVKCNVMGYPMQTLKEVNISAKGAFILAASTLGLFSSANKAAEELYGKTEKYDFYPNEQIHSLYDKIYRSRYLPFFESSIFAL